MVKRKIKERPECRTKIEKIVKDAGAVTFEDKYWVLWKLFYDTEKDKNYSKDMVKQIEKMFVERHQVYVDLGVAGVGDRNVYAICSKCGNQHMVNMEDQRKKVYGEFVVFLCDSCRPPKKHFNIP